jgi:hypothetical protein
MHQSTTPLYTYIFLAFLYQSSKHATSCFYDFDINISLPLQLGRHHVPIFLHTASKWHEYCYGGNVRGTILWGFLSSLLVCTWTVQHLRIPQAASKRKSLRGDWSHWGEEIGLQFKWMILTLLIPELLAGKELQDLIMARRSCRGRILRKRR